MSAAARGPRISSLAIAANNGDVGGGEVMLLNIAAALRKMAIEVRILAPTSPDGLLSTARERGFDVTPLDASTRASYMREIAAWRLRNLSVPLWCNGLVPTLATTAMGPRLAHLHLLPTGLNAAAARIGRLGARRLLVPSHFMSSRIPGATVLENWTEDIGFRDRNVRTTGLLRVGFLGRLTTDKGVHVLARALQEVIAQSDREVRLIIAGENRFGGSDDDREIAAALEPLTGSVDRLGWVDREEFFDQIDLAVFPSLVEESFGLVVAEAMARGVPFVISDAGALPEIAGPSHPWVVPRGDDGALAEMILSMIGELDDEGAQRDARRRWEERFSPAAGAGRVAELLLDLGQAAGTRRAGGRSDV